MGSQASSPVILSWTFRYMSHPRGPDCPQSVRCFGLSVRRKSCFNLAQLVHSKCLSRSKSLVNCIKDSESGARNVQKKKKTLDAVLTQRGMVNHIFRQSHT